MEQNRQSGGSGWIGWVLFFVLIFGSRFAPPVANWLSQTTGLPITPNGLMGTVAVLYIASLVLGPVIGMFLRNLGGGSGDTANPSLPSSTPMPGQASQAPFPSSPPPSSSLPKQPPVRLPPPTSAKTPGAPRWEPIIDPRILVVGIIGVVLFGGFFLLALLFTGTI